MICICLLLIGMFIARPTPVPNRGWHSALVVSVHDAGWSGYFEVIDSRDPDCRFKCAELRNPFKPLSISKGAKVQVNMQPRGTIYLVDEQGRVHNGMVMLVELMARRAAPRN